MSSSSEDSLQLVLDAAIDIRDALLEERESEDAPPRRRRYIERSRESAHERLINDYFVDNSTFQDYHFRRRFRMRKTLFMRIVRDMEGASDYFKQSTNAIGILGFHPIQKCTAVFRQLACATSPDALDESIRMSARTARESLDHFCTLAIQLYGPRYFRRPSPNDIQQLYAHHATVHGFPGMLGSLDCMHWRWNMCPTAYHGQYTKGNYGYPTVVLEALASQDLWFWHGYFGSPGSINDINILNNSPIFNKLYDGTAPDSSFVLRGTEYKYGYYLVDGIYPEHSVFVKSLSYPDDPQRIRFKRAQEKARKDIERAFGALKKRFQIIAKPSNFRQISTMTKVMYTCMILHNMILEDEGHAICTYDANEIVPATQPLEVCSEEYYRRMRIVHNTTIHGDLRRHLTDHLWTLNPKQIYSKWRTTNKSCMEFNGVYMNVHRTWQSGANDLDVVDKARAVYKQKFDKKFTNDAFWNVVRNKQKWLMLKTSDEFVTSSKRSKTSASTHSQSSDAHTGINLNNLDPYDDPLPLGRDQSRDQIKRKLKGVVGGSRVSDEKIDSFNTQIDKILSAQEVKAKNKLMEFVLRDISGLTGFEYQIAMQAKKDAARQLGYTFDD